jgi:hypothetical protein
MLSERGLASLTMIALSFKFLQFKTAMAAFASSISSYLAFRICSSTEFPSSFSIRFFTEGHTFVPLFYLDNKEEITKEMILFIVRLENET